MKCYEAYKDSRIEWIGDIPADWICANLGAIAKQRKNLNKDGEVDNVLSLSYGNIRRRVMDNTGLLPESFNTYNVIEDGDVVLRLTDLQNDQRSLRVGLCHERGIITAAYTTLEPQSIDSRYLFYSLAVFDYWKGFYGLAGGVRQSLTFDGIRSLRFPLPSRTEQQAIADYLDAKTAEIDALVTDCEREVGLLQEYRKAIISEPVTKGLDPDALMKNSGVEWIGEIPEGWTVKRIKEFCKLQTGHTPSTLRPEYFDGDVEWYTPGDIDNDIVSSSNRKVSELAIRDNQVPQYAPDSILLVAIGGTAGKVGYAPWISSSNQQITAIMPTTNEPKWLFYSLLSMQQHLFNLAMFTTLPILNNDYLSNFAVVVPPREEQLRIIEFLDSKTAEIDSLINFKQTMADKLREYRRSLIFEAVTGKFKVPGV